MSASVLVAAMMISIAPAPDEPVPLYAEWDAPAECPDRDGLLAAIEAVVGEDVAFDDEAMVRVSGRARAVDEVYRVELEIVVGDEREERVMTAGACGDAVQASALVIGVALEPFLSRASSIPGPAPTIEPSPVRPIATAPREEPPRPAPTRRRFDHRAALFVGGGGAFWTTDDAVGSISGGAAWLIDRARIELSGQHLFATQPEPDPSARMSLSGAALRGCWLPRVRMFEIGPCGGLEVMALRAQGTGDGVEPLIQTVPWVGLLAGLDVAWLATPWFAVRASVGAGFVPRRPQLHIDVRGTDVQVFLAPPVNARVTLALELRLPG